MRLFPLPSYTPRGPLFLTLSFPSPRRWFPLVGGSGSGRLRLSLLFKPLALDLAPSLREWSVGTLQIVEASLKGLDEPNFAGRLVMKAEQGESASVNAMQRQTEKGEPALRDLVPPTLVLNGSLTSGSRADDAISFDLSSTPASLPVLSRIAPIKVSVQGVAAGLKHQRPALASGLLHVSDVQKGETVELTVRMSRCALAFPCGFSLLDRSLTPRLARRGKEDFLPRPVPLPKVKGKDQEDGDGDGHANDTPAPDDDDETVSGNSDSDNNDADAAPIILTLRVRFVPGLSSRHANLVLSASSSARAAYHLYLHRRDYESQLRAADGGEDAAVAEPAPGDEWETATDAGGSGGAAAEIQPRRDGTRARKGGSLRWVRHNAKVLTRKVKKARAHQLNEPAPETEIQASL